MNRDASRFSATVFISAIMAIGCGRPSSPKPGVAQEPTPVAVAAAGRISGTLQDSDTGKPIADIDLALMIRGEGKGQWVPMKETDLTARSDAKGAFLFEHVPPNRYFVLADFDPVTTVPSTMLRGGDGTAVTVELDAGEAHDLGVVLVKKK